MVSKFKKAVNEVYWFLPKHDGIDDDLWKANVTKQ